MEKGFRNCGLFSKMVRWLICFSLFEFSGEGGCVVI